MSANSASVGVITNEESGVRTGPAETTRLNGELLRHVRISLQACLGNSDMSVEELMALKSGSVVTLETSLADHVDLYLNNVRIARGEVVAVGDKFGVRIVDIAVKP